MKITGETMIYKNDFGYSTSISTKNQEGTYDKMYLSVQFKRDDEKAGMLSNMTKIDIKNGFLTFYKGTAGMAKVKLVVLEYDIIDSNKPNNNYPDVEVNNIEDFNDDDLPF